jgi:hypothetical protein
MRALAAAAAALALHPVLYLLNGLPGSPSEYVDRTPLGSFADAGHSHLPALTPSRR